MKREKLTKDIVNSRVSVKGYRLIGEYDGVFKKTTFRHEVCGHEWDARPANIMNGKNCPSCSKKSKLTIDDVVARIPTDYRIVGEYKTALQKTLFTHLVCGYEWSIRPSHIMNGRGCPKCSTSGFDHSKPATAYVIDFGEFIKGGITNDLKRRLDEHRKRNGEFTLVYTKLYESGDLAADWERSIKTKYKGHYVLKEKCPDGYTETFHPSLLSELTKEQQ